MASSANSLASPPANPTQLTLTFTPEYEVISTEATTLTFNSRMIAPEVEEDTEKRSAISLTAVLDKSGSMQGEKLSLVKRTCEFMLSQFSARDKLGVVEYDSDVNELIQLSKTSEAFKAEATTVLKGMEAGSCTNLSGGLWAGVQQQQQNTFVDWDKAADVPPGDQPPSETVPSRRGSFSSASGTDSEDSDDSSYGVKTPTQQAVTAAGEPGEAENARPSLLSRMLGRSQSVRSTTLQNTNTPQKDAHQKVTNSALQKSKSFTSKAIKSLNKLVEKGKKKKTAPAPRQPDPQALHGCANIPGGALLFPTGSFRAQSFRARSSQLGGRLLRPKPRATRVFAKKTAPAGEKVEADALRSVFLFTDGLANEGITDAKQMVATLKSMLDCSPRVRVYTFGFGSDHSAELLSELAEAGAGTYYFMEKEENIPRAFADALGGLLSVAAQNVRVEFVPGEGVRVAKVHTAFATKEEAAGGTSVSVGDIFSEEGKDVLWDVALPACGGGGEAGGVFRMGTLRLSYLDVQAARMCSVEVACEVRRVGKAQLEAEGPVGNIGIAEQRGRIDAANGLRDAQELAEKGDYRGARETLAGALGRVERLGEGGLKMQLGADLREAVTNMADRSTYTSKGSKLMSAKCKAHYYQRSACLSDSSGGEEEEEEAARAPRSFSYANSSQKAMRRKAKSAFAR